MVLDNAAIHTSKGNKYLENFVWHELGVFILFLPTLSPEWNPQELGWRVMVRGMQSYPLCVLREVDRHTPAFAANEVLSTITHGCVCGFFRKSQVL